MSRSTADAPVFKHLYLKHTKSPKELKDKMRKDYKEKVKNCRHMLLDTFRGPEIKKQLCTTLTNIYKSMCNHPGEIENDEIEVLEELKNELVQEELEWWLKEHEKSQLENVDWSKIEENDSVICPVCQKSNFQLNNNNISCTYCTFNIKTQKSLVEIRKSIMSCVEMHSSACIHEPMFSVISEANEAHIYLICNNCTEMNIIL